MKDAICRRARELGFDDCRVTSADPPKSAGDYEQWLNQGRHGEMAYLARNKDKRADPTLVLPGARSILCLAAAYPEVMRAEAAVAAETPSGTGVVARYARFSDYHDVIAERLKTLAVFMDDLGGAYSRSLWYLDTGPILERDFAQRAGLGFVGKHTNLISRKLGNWIFLAEILTTLELEPDEPERNRCGRCTQCITACPTAAITAPFQLDARRCISYLTIELRGPIPLEFREAMGARIFGCDDCLAACPWNRFAREGSIMKAYASQGLAAPDLIELLALDDAGFRQRFASTPISRAKRSGLQRNVCVALGNVGDNRALPSLEKTAGGPDAMVAEHARWAMDRIQQRVP
jgi:epoxyqueuosine reductase